MHLHPHAMGKPDSAAPASAPRALKKAQIGETGAAGPAATAFAAAPKQKQQHPRRAPIQPGQVGPIVACLA